MNKLIPGSTILGTAYRKAKDGTIYSFTVYFGNALSPILDGKVGHLPQQEYLDLLNNFLNGVQPEKATYNIASGGKEFEKPTKKEIMDAAIAMLNREKEMNEKMKKRPVNLVNDNLNATYAKPETAGTAKPESAEEQKPSEKQVEQKQEEKPTPKVQDTPPADPSFTQEDRQKLDIIQNQFNMLLEQNEKVLNKKSEQKTVIKKGASPILLVLVLLISLASLAVNGFSFYQNYFAPKEEPKTVSDFAQIDINGTTYEIPVGHINYQDGEVKLNLYGLYTYQEDGQTVNKAIPLGEYDITNMQQ